MIFGVSPASAKDFCAARNGAADRAPGAFVDEGVCLVEEDVAAMQHIGIVEVDVDVGVGVRRIVVNQVDVSPLWLWLIVVANVVAGESARRIGRNRHVEQLHLCGLRHARLCFLVGDHVVSGRVHAFVPVDMVNMPVGIDERMRRIGAHRGDCLANVRNRRRKARINQDDAVFAGSEPPCCRLRPAAARCCRKVS